MDIHAWIVDNEDNIFDPHFSIYDYIKEVNNCEGERCYEPLSPEKQKEMFHKFMTQATNMFGKNFCTKTFLYKFYTNPRPTMCFVNSLAFKKCSKRNCKIVIGKMGWRKKGSNEIFWEYG